LFLSVLHGLLRQNQNPASRIGVGGKETRCQIKILVPSTARHAPHSTHRPQVPASATNPLFPLSPSVKLRLVASSATTPSRPSVKTKPIRKLKAHAHIFQRRVLDRGAIRFGTVS
jgi:hypothetical protein